MGYRACFFAVATADAPGALAQFTSMARELRSENGYTGMYLAAADRGGLTVINLTASPAPRGRVPRDFFTEMWSAKAPLYVAVYNDKSGVYLWERHAPGKMQGICNDAHLVGTHNLDLTVDYAGKGFTHAQLAKVMAKKPSAMTPREARAVMEWTDAITIGIAQHGFTAKRGDFLDLFSAKQAWSLFDGKMVPLPDNAGLVADPYLDELAFATYKLEFRSN